MAIEIIALDESEIEVHIQGKGEGVVLLSGMGTDVSALNKLSDRLNHAGYQTIGINYRGIAGSTGPLEGATLHDFSGDVAGVVKRLGMAPIHVVGAATGSRVARCLGTDFPEIVKTLTLLGAGGIVEPDPRAASALRRLFQADLSEHEQLEAARIALFSPVTDIEEVGMPMKPWPVIHQHVRIFLGTPVDEWWKGGDAPIHVIQGLDDRIALPENGRKLYEQYRSRVHLSEIENGGHVFFLERPDVVADAVIAYLEKTA